MIAALLLIAAAKLPAQETDTIEYEGVFTVIQMDSFIVTAKRTGFSVEDFIARVRKDESFYKAFKHLRYIAYSFSNDVRFFDKKNKQKARYQSHAHQSFDAHCRSMETSDEKVEGDFYDKRKRYNYYTAKLYDRLFFTHGKLCDGAEPEDVQLELDNGEKGMEKYVTELKKLIFRPGERADVPFIGKKTAIFDPDMMEYYDFSISSKNYQGKHDCYVFAAVVKPEFETRKENKTVVKRLETYFEKGTFRVVARNYQLKYNGLAYSFDVAMDIELSLLANDKYAPTYIRYDGVWDVPFKKPEKAIFETRFFGFGR